MNTIQLQIQSYLERVLTGEAAMPPHIIEEAARQFKRTLERQFNSRRKRDFTLRLSNIGRPVCQLWHEKNGTVGEPLPYSFPLKMAFGDTTEIILLAIMKAAGVDIEAINDAGSIEIAGETINGTSDVTIDGKVWDIKSASKFAFEQKYSNPYGYSNLKSKDDFGYVAQGVGYSEALKQPFGGWIAVNKESGEVATLEVPESDIEADKASTLASMERTVRLLESPEFPGREFEDVPETYRKKPTGNRVLCKTCEYCAFKHTCWPNLQYLPAQASTAADPAYKYYTHVEAKDEVSR